MLQTLSLSKVINPRPGWYRGDFHCHTNFSDGVHTPAELLDVARAEKLDYFAITDHNTIDGYPGFSQASDLLVIPGMEITIETGHFNVFGIPGRQEWMDHICLGQTCLPQLPERFSTITQLMQATAGLGLLNSINHPLLVPWAWQYPDTQLGHVNCLEIWNDPGWFANAQANPQAVDMWTRWLNDGYRITAIGGSDYHTPNPPPDPPKPPDRLGLPSTYVYAAELSAAAILNGLRRRQAYVSMGAQVEFEVQANGRVYTIGDDLGLTNNDLHFTATVTASPAPGYARLLKNGNTVLEAAVDDLPARLQYTAPANPAAPAWYRLDVFDRQGNMLAVTNPIFAGPQLAPGRQTYGEFLP